MAEEFINQGGVCSGKWWNPSRNTLFGGRLLPCSGAACDVASFTWPVDSNIGCLASSPVNCDWSQGLLFGGGASKVIRTSNQSNPSKVVHEGGSSDTSQIRNSWSPGMTGSFSRSLVDDHEDTSSQISAFNRQISFPAQTSESYANHNLSSSGGYHSSKVKSFLLDQPPLLFENRPNLPVVDCSSQFLPNYGSGWSADSSPTSFGKLPALLKPINSSLHNPRQASQLQFPSGIPYNASMSALDDIRASLLASPESSLNRSNLITKASSQYSQISGSLEKKVSQEPAPKRPRIETPSPLPTFKVRKEKLGDRITALQQLVSPFGKTDTASVLHEAIEYIKFLHDQVNALSTPYMKNGAPFQHQQASTERALKGTEGPEQDLSSRGLCLVPISSTFPVTCEIPTDFCPPTFRGSFQ